MRREVFDCDKCKTKGVSVVTIGLPVSKDIDPAGGSSTPSYQDVDLCLECAGKLIHRLAKNNSYEENKTIIENLRKGKMP